MKCWGRYMVRIDIFEPENTICEWGLHYFQSLPWPRRWWSASYRRWESNHLNLKSRVDQNYTLINFQETETESQSTKTEKESKYLDGAPILTRDWHVDWESYKDKISTKKMWNRIIIWKSLKPGDWGWIWGGGTLKGVIVGGGGGGDGVGSAYELLLFPLDLLVGLGVDLINNASIIKSSPTCDP